MRLLVTLMLLLVLGGCVFPSPSGAVQPTQPAVLLITPAPTLDADATATAMIVEMRAASPIQGRVTVTAGDTLADIAARFGISVDALAQANNLPSPDAIEPGQELIIPVQSTPTPPPDAGDAGEPSDADGASDADDAGNTETNE